MKIGEQELEHLRDLIGGYLNCVSDRCGSRREAEETVAEAQLGQMIVDEIEIALIHLEFCISDLMRNQKGNQS